MRTRTRRIAMRIVVGTVVVGSILFVDRPPYSQQ
jgi:hypothetical protein